MTGKAAFFLFFFIITTSASWSADRWKEINTINIAGITNETPLEFHAKKTGRPTGIYVDLWQRWSRKTGIAVNYKITTPEAAENALESGAVDVVMGYHSMSRVNYNFIMSKSLYNYSTYIYKSGNIKVAETLKDLSSYKVGIQKKENQYNYLMKLYPDIIFVEMESIHDIISAAEQDKISVFISGTAVANFELSRQNLWRKFSQSEDAVFTHLITAAVKRENQTLLDVINNGFDEVSQAEELAIEKKWTGGNFGLKIPWVYITAIITIIIILSGVTVVWYWNYHLKKEVSRATSELSESREFLQSILNSMPSMICTINCKGEILSSNSAVKPLSGRSEILTGEKLWDIFPQIISDSKSLTDAVEKGRIFEIKQQISSADERYYDIFLYPVATSKGKCSVVRIDDVTERVAKDKQLIQAQRMELIGIMAGGLAHDFNNILGAIYGTVSMLNHQIKEKTLDEDTLKDYAGVIEQASERAAGVVKRFLLISRKSEPLFNPFDLNSAVIQVVNICRNSIDWSVDIQLNLTDENSVVMADIRQIEQAILNLCINAAHAMTIMRNPSEKMGGILTVTTERVLIGKEISIGNTILYPGIYMVIRVKDTGVGINSEIKEKLFDPFFTTKEEKHGTGLGLLMVRNIIKEHGGMVDVTSIPGTGSEFSLYLPASEMETIDSADREECKLIGRGKILLIDDELLVRKTVSRMLISLGYSVVSAESGFEGMSILGEQMDGFNAVITDLSLPIMSG